MRGCWWGGRRAKTVNLLLLLPSQHMLLRTESCILLFFSYKIRQATLSTSSRNPTSHLHFFYCVLRNLLLIPSPSSQRCKIKTMRLPVIVCVQPARTETQQTKDDDVLYLNTIQCCREKKRACRFFINHFLINAHV